MFGDGLRPPIRFQPILSPALVAGAEVTGNKKGEVTERGKTFLLTVINLLHGSIKVFNDQESVVFDSSIWPGLELDPSQDTFQFVEYVGKDSAHAVNWGDLFRVDYDFDGNVDAGRTIENGVPFYLYKQVISGQPKVDYELIWDEVKDNLESKNNFWEDIQNTAMLKTDEECFAFLVGLNQTKRNWVYGMQGIGINPFTGTADNLENIYDSWKIKEAGALNIQVIKQYILLQTIIAERFNTVADNSWVKGNAVLGAKNYYASRIAGVDIEADSEKVNGFRSIFNAVKAALNSAGTINIPAKGRTESAEAYQARINELFSQAAGHLSSMYSLLSGLKTVYSSMDNGFGLVSGNLSATEKMLFDKVEEYKRLIPGSIDDNTNFDALIAKLNEINSILSSIDSIQANIKANPGSLIDEIYNELKAALSTTPLSDEIKAVIKGKFSFEMSKPLGFVSAVMATNGMFRTINRSNNQRYQIKVEEKYLEKKEEAKAESKHTAQKKQEEKKAAAHAQQEKKAASKNHENRKIAPKAQAANKPKNKGG